MAIKDLEESLHTKMLSLAVQDRQSMHRQLFFWDIGASL